MNSTYHPELIMPTDDLQSAYHKAFNQYLKGIQTLLSAYSIREIAKLFAHIEYQHIRLASELKTLDDSINPYCLYELREMPKADRRHWLKYIKDNKTTPTQLRALIGQTKKKKAKKRADTTMRQVWLLNRKLKGCGADEKQRLINLINDNNI